MKKVLIMLAAIGLLATAAPADVVFDFTSGGQGWGSFGPITTDSGLLPTGGVGGTRGRYHVGDFEAGGWGMVDISPVVDLSGLTTMSVDAKLISPVANRPFTGSTEVEFMLAVGAAEWFYKFNATTAYQTYSVPIASLTPNYYANLSPYFGSLPALNDPGLHIQLVTRTGGKTGIGELDYDNVTVTPEPGTLAVLTGGALATLALRRRRSA
jgi:hypothetical protein